MKNSRLIITIIFFSFLCAISSASPTFANDQEEFVIGVAGNNPFGDILDKIAEKMDVKGRKLTIKYFQSAEKTEKFQMLFVSSSEKDNLEKITSHLKGLPALLIGDTPGFTERGAAFNFFTNKKVQFQINLPALNRSGLKTSARLLSLGEITE